MKKIILVLFTLLSLLLILCGCAKVNAPTIPNLVGKWNVSGTAPILQENSSYMESGVEFPTEATLYIAEQMSNGRFEGIGVLYGDEYGPGETGIGMDISGIVSLGGNVELCLDFGPDATGSSFIFSGKVDGNSMIGTYIWTEIYNDGSGDMTATATGTWQSTRE